MNCKTKVKALYLHGGYFSFFVVCQLQVTRRPATVVGSATIRDDRQGFHFHETLGTCNSTLYSQLRQTLRGAYPASCACSINDMKKQRKMQGPDYNSDLVFLSCCRAEIKVFMCNS